MAADEFAGFAAAAPSQDEFAGFAPAPTASADADAPQTTAGAVQAVGSGLTSGIAQVAGLPVDTARNAVELGRAAVGSAYGAATSRESTPAGETLTPDATSTRTTHGLYHYIDPTTGADTFSKSPPPAGAKPFKHVTVSIPSFLQPVDAGQDLGSSESIKRGIRAVLGDDAVDLHESTPLNRVLHATGQGAAYGVLAPGSAVAATTSGALGGAASQTVKENGGGPLAQTLAGLAVGSVPAVASGAAQGARALIRNQADTAGRVADAAASNTQLTAGQATGSKLLQKIEAGSSKVWGGGPVTQAADNQTENLGGHIDNVVKNLANGGDVSPTGAGTAINAGAATTKANMRSAEKAAYEKVDQLVPGDHPVDMSGTLAKLEELSKPTPGAEATTGALVSPKIIAMRDNLKADIAANSGSPAIPYSAASDLRTKLGNTIDWGFAPADPVANGALKQVHGALTADRNAAATAVSPEARQAVTSAGNLYKANEARRDLLNGVIDKAGGPEAVYRAATNGTKQGATKIGGVMAALDPGQQNLVRATVINRLGKATPGMQNSEGDAFNASTFLTNWNKLDATAKDALFGAKGPTNQLRRGLDSFANTTSTIRNSTLYKNPSGTAAAAGHGYGLFALLGEAGAAVAGHPHALAVSAGAIAGNSVLARALTNPRVVHWLATTAKMPTPALPNAVNQLVQMGKTDPDARDLAARLPGQHWAVR